MNETKRPMANPMVVLREEFDDWALLFDPDVNEIYVADPVSVFIWKHLDGNHTAGDILEELRRNCDDVPKDALSHIDGFIQDLEKKGLAGHEVET